MHIIGMSFILTMRTNGVSLILTVRMRTNGVSLILTVRMRTNGMSRWLAPCRRGFYNGGSVKR